MIDDSGDRLEEHKVPVPSDIIAGKYEVEQVVASGGMGIVVAARHLHLDQRVAVKFLLPHMAARQDIVSRFLREARAAVSLRGEHALRVYDVGVLETGAPYMVMEYLRGHDLDEELKRVGPIPVADAAAWVLQACEAVAEAHALGIVHRDLKPANLFLARQPDGSRIVKVLDFGISKVSDSDGRDAQKLTSTQTVLGSPQYMSPEQVRNARSVDARSDIWALGVVLYELVTDLPPFPADTVPALSAMIVSDPPVPMNADAVPLDFQGVVLRCLEKDPEKRYANIVELAKALVPFAPDAARVAERVAGIARSAGHSERPPSLRDSEDAPAATRQRVRPPSPDAETVSAAGLAMPVTANSAPDGSTFSATLESAGARPVRRLALVALGALLGVVVLAVVVVRSGSSEPKRPTSPSVPVAAPAGPPAEAVSVEDTQAAPLVSAVVPAASAGGTLAAATAPSQGAKAATERIASMKNMRAHVGGPAPLVKSQRQSDPGSTVSPAPAMRKIDPLGDRK